MKLRKSISVGLFSSILLIGAMFYNSCQKETLPPVDLFYEYFPLVVGASVVYEIDSIVYDDFTGTIDTFHYYVKELVESEFIDADESPSFRLERFIRYDEEQEWAIKNIWKARRQNANALKTEENITYIKLIFPPENNSTWDGNAFNIMPSQNYKYINIHSPHTIDNLVLDSTITVVQKEFETIISEDYQIEVFAKNIGLVYKKYISLEKEVDGTIIRGVDYSYKMVQSGN
jgi:hypothetical protein